MTGLGSYLTGLYVIAGSSRGSLDILIANSYLADDRVHYVLLEDDMILRCRTGVCLDKSAFEV